VAVVVRLKSPESVASDLSAHVSEQMRVQVVDPGLETAAVAPLE